MYINVHMFLLKHVNKYIDSSKEGDGIILLLLVAFAVTNHLSILPKSRQQLVWVKPWLQQRSTKIVYHNI